MTTGKKIITNKKEFFGLLCQIAFEYSLIYYLIFYVIETISPNFINRFYSFNYHLVLVIIFGVLSVILKPNHEKNIEQTKIKVKVWEYVLIFLLALASVVIIWYKTSDLGWLSIVISILSGLIIILISLLSINDKDLDDE